VFRPPRDYPEAGEAFAPMMTEVIQAWPKRPCRSKRRAGLHHALGDRSHHVEDIPGPLFGTMGKSYSLRRENLRPSGLSGGNCRESKTAGKRTVYTSEQAAFRIFPTRGWGRFPFRSRPATE